MIVVRMDWMMVGSSRCAKRVTKDMMSCTRVGSSEHRSFKEAGPGCRTLKKGEGAVAAGFGVATLPHVAVAGRMRSEIDVVRGRGCEVRVGAAAAVSERGAWPDEEGGVYSTSLRVTCGHWNNTWPLWVQTLQ